MSVAVLSAVKRLESAALGTLELSYANGYVVTAFDLGSPTVRAVTSSRINANGEDDTTALLGARAVSFTVRCFAPEDGSRSRRSVLERLRAYASPAHRPVLVFCEDDGVERRVVLRGEAPTWPLTPEGSSVTVQMAFVAPSGLLEAAAASVVVVSAQAAPEPGRTYPLRYPRIYPAGSVTGTVEVVNGEVWGAPADFVAQLWGPCASPVLTNVTTGGVLSLPGLTLGADQYAEVDVREATIRLNGRPSESLYGFQEWGVSSFWQLAGGENLLRYSPATYEAAARAVVTFRAASL